MTWFRARCFAWCLALVGAGQVTAQTPMVHAGSAEIDGDADGDARMQDHGTRRVADPIRFKLAGQPLLLSGEVSLEQAWSTANAHGGSARLRHRINTGALELQAATVIGERLSLFAQVRLIGTREYDGANSGAKPMQYAQRGETWLAQRDIAGTGLTVEVGRLKFEDQRHWWWDQELDALRVSGAGLGVAWSMAIARELGSDRSDRKAVQADHRGVWRWFAQSVWDWSDHHSLALYVLRHDDRSRRESFGQGLATATEDGSDARLTWGGLRLTGQSALASRGSLHYWFDLARVDGRERKAEFEVVASPSADPQSRVVATSTHRVRGWAHDVGLRWELPILHALRLTMAHAMARGGGFGFRQTGLQSNEADFGAAKGLARYGTALEPELSNLAVSTLGLGMALGETATVDLVIHRYRQPRPSADMRHVRIADASDGRHTNIGHGVDLVWTVLPRSTLELSATLSGFRAGRAFGALAGRWHCYTAMELRISF